MDDYHKTPEPIVHVLPIAGEDSDNLNHNVHVQSRKASWKVTILSGAGAASFVLVVNIGVLAWTLSSFERIDGVAAVYTGSCSTSKRGVAVADLFINILSTILLGASNTCAQVLVAPSRKEVDEAHSRGSWLDIGVPSVRNLGHIPSWRGWLWALLFLSSIPLHLLYNSVVFYTASAVDYQAAVVTEDFLHGAWWNVSRVLGVESISPTPDVVQLQQLQTNVGQLSMLSNAECIQNYAASMTESGWRNVLVVTSLSLDDSLLNVYSHYAGSYVSDIAWPCKGDDYTYGAAACDAHTLIDNAASWTIPNIEQCQECGVWPNNHDCLCNTMSAPIKYCLAEPFPARCTVNISTSLLAVVIVANVLKVVAMLTTALSSHVPLATIGDAIATFLTQPDRHTMGKGPLSAGDVKKGRLFRNSNGQIAGPRPFSRKKHRWARSVSWSRWIICVSLCSAVWGAALALLLIARVTIKGSPHDVSIGYTIRTSLPPTFIANVLLVNVPQIVVSLCYLFYNNVLTCMLLAHEYSQFARRRKPLRVTQPRGEQRTTYRLQLPYIYVIPLMAAMAVLHWLVSRSLFLVELSIYGNNGVASPRRNINTIGYATSPLLAALALGGGLILVLVGLSARALDPGMPVASSCSAAISAACADANEPSAALVPLQYGVLAHRASSPDGGQYVGLSSSEVAPLQDGVVYQ